MPRPGSVLRLSNIEAAVLEWLVKRIRFPTLDEPLIIEPEALR